MNIEEFGKLIVYMGLLINKKFRIMSIVMFLIMIGLIVINDIVIMLVVSK